MAVGDIAVVILSIFIYLVTFSLELFATKDGQRRSSSSMSSLKSKEEPFDKAT